MDHADNFSPMLDYLERCVKRLGKESGCTDLSSSPALGSFSSSKFTTEMLSSNTDDFFDNWCRDMETVNGSSPESTPMARKLCPALRTHRLLSKPDRSKSRRRLLPYETPTLSSRKRRNNSPVGSSSKCLKRLPMSPEPPQNDSHIDSRLLLSPETQPAVLPPQKSATDLPSHSDGEELLPTINGKIADVKSISAQTMADIITGRLSVDADVTIVDCRYPYEYDGGHIRGAINLFTPAEVTERFFPTTDVTSTRRHVIIFHCEFSSERGPKMYRHLRQHDRHVNAHNYPELSYPNIYLLNGGYSAFYPDYKTLCDPEGYTSMFHADHKQDMRKFRVKSKSWPLVKSRRDGNADVRKTLLF